MQLGITVDGRQAEPKLAGLKVGDGHGAEHLHAVTDTGVVSTIPLILMSTGKLIQSLSTHTHTVTPKHSSAHSHYITH